MHPFSHITHSPIIRQFTFNGAPWGVKFCLSENDTRKFADMLNEAYTLGRSLFKPLKSEPKSPQGLSASVNEQINTQ